MMEAPNATSRTFDNTRVSAYKFCPRSFFIRHIMHWTNDGGTAPALVFGSAWHSGMDAMWTAGGGSPLQLANLAYDAFVAKWIEEGYDYPISMERAEQLGARTPGVAREMYHAYATNRQRPLAEATVLGVEQPFAVPIPGVSDAWYIGKLDKVITWNGNKVVLEHKTTTAYSIQYGFQPDWTQSWYAAPQVKGYEFGAGLYYPGLDGVWVDGALVHKKVHDAFKFIPVKHQLPILIEWLQDTTNWILRIEEETKIFKATGKLTNGLFPKNEDNCYGKYGTCPFLDICKFCTDPSQLDGPPAGFKESEWNPFDVLRIDKLLNKGGQDA